MTWIPVIVALLVGFIGGYACRSIKFWADEDCMNPEHPGREEPK